MQPLVPPPIWAVYLVTKRDLLVVPLALGLAVLLAFRVVRSLRWAERSPYQPVTLLPGWLIWTAAFCLFYLGLSQALTGLSLLVQSLAPSLGWSFTPPFAPVVSNEPIYFLDAGLLIIAALWILLTGRDYPAPADESDEDEAELDEAAADAEANLTDEQEAETPPTKVVDSR